MLSNLFRSLGTASGVQWSEFLATDIEVLGSIPGSWRFFWEAAGLERDPLSLVRITEDLIEGKVAAPV
jgi:hypothetical protein